MIHYYRGEYDEAMKLYKESLDIDQRLGNQSGLAMSCGQLGRLLESQGYIEKAIKYYEKTLRIVEKLGIKTYMQLVKKDLQRAEQKKARLSLISFYFNFRKTLQYFC